MARVCAESAAQASRPAAPRANREVRTDIERPSPCLVVIVKIALKQTLTENAAGAESHCTSAMVAKIVRVAAKARLWEQAELAARAESDESPSKKSTENQTHRSRRSLRTSCLHHPTDHGGGGAPSRRGSHGRNRRCFQRPNSTPSSPASFSIGLAACSSCAGPQDCKGISQ